MTAKRKEVEVPEAIEMIPLSKLVTSPLNMRVAAVDKKADKSLKASLESFGVLQNLIVHETKGKKFGVAGGARRLKLLLELADEGLIKKKDLIPCNIVPEENALAASLAENQLRTAPHPADEFIAYKNMSDQGIATKVIAAQFGVSNNYVNQRMALGKLHPKLIEFFRADKLTMSSVQAYTIEPDQDLQLKAYNDAVVWERNSSHAIKKRLIKTDMRSSDAVIKFIGLAAYKKAGGAFISDMFESEVHVLDKDLVARLLAEKLEPLKEKYLADGWSWVEFATVEKNTASFADFAELDGELSDKLKKELKKLEAELKTLDEDSDEHEALAWKIDEFEIDHQDEWVYPTETKAKGGVFLGFKNDGVFWAELGLQKNEDIQAPGSESDGQDGLTTDNQTPAEKPLYSQSLIEDLGYHRTQALKLAMWDKKRFDLPKLFAFNLCDRILGTHDHWEKTFVEIGPSRIGGFAADVKHEQESANIALKEIEKGQPKEWTKPHDMLERFDLFSALKPCQQDDLFAIAMIKEIHVMAKGRDNFSDDYIARFNIPFHELITLTFDNFFSRVGKSHLLDIVEEVLDADRRGDLKNKSKKELACFLNDLFNNQVSWTDEKLSERPTWMPKGII